MSKIIAARIETQERADIITSSLYELGIDESDVQTFYVNPPGQHGTFPLGGDMYQDPGAEPAAKGQLGGVGIGAAAGAAVGVAAATVAAPIVAPAVAVALTAAGAHVGGLAGAMSKTRDADEEATATRAEKVDTRHGGLMVAARVTAESEQRVIDALRRAGAEDIERAEGQWTDGNWVDFNPLVAPKLVDAPDATSVEHQK